jgi:hypothetical protein
MSAKGGLACCSLVDGIDSSIAGYQAILIAFFLTNKTSSAFSSEIQHLIIIENNAVRALSILS